MKFFSKLDKNFEKIQNSINYPSVLKLDSIGWIRNSIDFKCLQQKLDKHVLKKTKLDRKKLDTKLDTKP